jgi:cation-transporting P-type ATPase I
MAGAAGRWGYRARGAATHSPARHRRDDRPASAAAAAGLHLDESRSSVASGSVGAEKQHEAVEGCAGGDEISPENGQVGTSSGKDGGTQSRPGAAFTTELLTITAPTRIGNGSHHMDIARVVRRCVGAGVQAAAAGAQLTGTVGAASVHIASVAASAALSSGINVATLPIRVSADLILGSGSVDSVAEVAREFLGGTASRRCWQGADRAWVEVRGLGAPSGAEVGAAVLAALRAHPRVVSVQLNVPLSRVVISVADDGPPLDELCDLVAAAENVAAPAAVRERVPDLPGDGVVLMGRLAALTANSAGLCAAVTARAMGVPRLPALFSAAVTVVDYQPRLRRVIEDRLGSVAADTVISMAAATAYTLAQAPASLAVDLAVQVIHAAESRSGQRSWSDWEPSLAEHADCPQRIVPQPRPRPRPPGPVERHSDRSGLAQIAGATAIGIATRSPAAAATAAAVTTPKAARTARESFAGTLGRALADRHAVLALRPEALRRLDRVDVVLFDPRVLCTGALRVHSIRGVPDAHRVQAWAHALAELNRGSLTAGWHRLQSPWSSGGGRRAHFDVLICHAPDRLASAVIDEARSGEVEVMSLDIEDLGDLRSAFDDLRPMTDQSVEAALARTVAELQDSDHTVALVTSGAGQALSGADVAIGLCPGGGEPTWHAHLMVPDLASVWQLIHALPAARAASRSGVQISIGASVLGSLLMLPGVRGRGPGPVTAGAGAGLWTGYRLARDAMGAELPTPADVQDWHAMSVAEVRSILPQPDADSGHRAPRALPRAVAEASIGLLGRVAGPPQRLASEFIGAVRTELADPLTPVLAIGAAASAVLGSPVDAVLVGSVLGGNAALAASQQVHAQRLLRRLLAIQVPPARRVFEDAAGRRYEDIPAPKLQPGDVIEVRTNEVVPADARLIEAIDLEVDEAALTGESLPVTKQVAATPGVPLADRTCMVFAQTTVVTGTALAVVTAVADQTQARRALHGGPAGDPNIGLQAQLAALTDRVWPVSLAGGAVVSALGLLRRGGLRTAVASGVAVSVAAVPEGLPLVATLAQQASARRLTRAGALVRSPRSVEALGRVDVVCFDKTGTLSENRLRVSRVQPGPGLSAEEVLACASRATAGPVGGRHLHATDSAVIDAAAKATAQTDPGERLAHLPFRSGRPYSASVYGAELSVKGAPEVLLASCLGSNETIGPTLAEMAADGLRVIAVARRVLTPAQVDAATADPDALADLCSEGLQMVGLFGLSDTPRPQAAALLAALADQQLGIRLITGDHPITARAIAAELGLDVAARQVITGSQWDALPRRGQERAVTERVIFARMSPEHKVQVVQTLERVGLVCAMVGDGANDAAAMRAATVGVGVVSRGSDPARLAADVMLLDGRIEALLDALDEGRQLWRRVQAAVAVLLGGNAGEVAFAIIGSALTGRAPLNTRQLLLVNMLTDALPAAALAVSPPNARMRSAGKGPDQAALWRTVAVRGGATAAAATGAWAAASLTGRPQRASTVALVGLVGAQLGQTLLDSHSPLVVLTAAGSMTALAGVVMTPGLSQLLGCTPLGPLGWSQALGSAAVATAGAALLPALTERLFSPKSSSPDSDGAVADTLKDDTDQSTISTTPARHSSAYSSRNGTANKRATVPVNGSASEAPLVGSGTPSA